MAGIYVHVPFCRAKCAYCDFYSVARADLTGDFTTAVAKEYRQRRHQIEGLKVDTIYFGGGTPSTLTPEVLETILRLFPQGASEITLEVNPEDVNPTSARQWRSAGFNRVSMGVQSLDDAELRAVRRRHSATGALKAIDILKNAGFDNISADLIFGLPGQTTETFTHSLKRLLQAGISHLSAYLLSYEPGTLLYRRLQQGEIAETDDTVIEEMYRRLCTTAKEFGFHHYEISNFAIPGRESQHNAAYWRFVPYLGLGPGAHSLGPDGRRRFNDPDIKRYLHDPSAVNQTEETDRISPLNEKIMLGLRTADGLDPAGFGPADRKVITAKAAPFVKNGELRISGGHILIPEEKWLMADAIIRELFFET